MRSHALSLYVLLAAPLLLAQTPLARAPGVSVVAISPSGGRYSEPGIAINPANANQILAVFQGGAAVQGTATAAYSRDAGATFSIASGAGPTDWHVAGDVTAAFDNRGHAFICYLVFDRLGTSSYWAHNAGRNGIYVRRSPDGGKTWDATATAVKAFPDAHADPRVFEDEPRIFADVGPNSRFAGNLYVGWVEWQLGQSVMLFSRSTDDGATWSTPAQISTHPGLPRDDNGSLGGFVQAIAADGSIYAMWNDGNSLTLTESHDGGETFSRPRAVVETGPPYFGEVPGVSRVEGFAQIGVDARAAGKHSRLYVCWSDYRNGDVDVFISSSADSGRKWSAPVRVNDDPLHDGSDQFFQWMTVDPVSGDVYVLFYDRRDDPKNRDMKITLARSTDGGHTFRNYAWTEEAFDGRGAFLGDYTWLAAYKNRVYGVWTETAPEKAESAGASRRGPETLIRAGVADFSATQ